MKKIEYTISQDFASGHAAEQGQRLRGFHGEGNSNESTSWDFDGEGNWDFDREGNYDFDRPLQLSPRDLVFEPEMMAQQEREIIVGKTKALAQSRAEHGESLRKWQKLHATANDIDDNLCTPSASSDDAISSHFRTLYKVDCTAIYTRSYHLVNLFEDEPFADSSSQDCEGMQNERQFDEVHIKGRVPIYNLGKYMEENSDLAFIVLRRCECPGKTTNQEGEIYITSSTLRSALYAVAQCYISNLSRAGYNDATASALPPPLAEEQFLQEPYLYVYYHRLPLQRYVAGHPEASVHVNSLLTYTSRMYGNSYREADMLFRERRMTREHELTLYRPNDIVVKFDTDLGEHVAYAVQKWAALTDAGNFRLTCWHWQMDGVGLARKQRQWVIPRIPEDKVYEIEKLTFVPLHFINPDVSTKLASRGQKHWELRNQSYVSYKGWNKSKDYFYPDSRFMIDHRTYRRIHPESEAFGFETTGTLPYDPRPSRESLETEGSQDLYLLLPPDTYGFYFTEKKWINILVDNIGRVTWNKTAYERLVLPPQTKELVKALVTVRTSERGSKQGPGLAGKREDIIAGKGNGLIMLLHGGPGTGKSLTAESVAEVAEMPLYRVTCGDVGTSAEMVEIYLNNVLTLGKEWNCVLLLDEADVFLEERSMSDLKRNSLVSGKRNVQEQYRPETVALIAFTVFLRVLEYYDGILMLTSNRVGIFDEAFKSRIQVALYYKALTRPSRKKIWQNFLEMLEEDQEDVDFDELHNRLDELANHELNGRQIRNSLTTARRLAIYKKEQLEWSHLETALSVSTEFNSYIKRVQRHTDDQWATEEGFRA